MASLRAVALQRLGRLAEAVEAAEALLAEAPPDDHALGTLALVLKPAGRIAELGAAFERAAAKDPADESLARSVLLSAVREADAAAMQRAALRLDKAFGGAALARRQEPPHQYKWWAALAAVLQARDAALAERDEEAVAGGGTVAPAPAPSSSSSSPPQPQQRPKKSALLLQLAEGMVRRLNASSVAAEDVLRTAAAAAGVPPPAANPLALTREAAMLHLGLLQALGRCDEALDLLYEEGAEAAPAPTTTTAPPRGAYASAIPLAEERLLARAALLQARGDLPAAARLYARHLREHAPDDWASGRHYLDCLLGGAAAAAAEEQQQSTSARSSLSSVVAATAVLGPQVPHVSSAAVAREVLGLNSGCGHADAGVVFALAAGTEQQRQAVAAADDEQAETAAVREAEQLIADLERIQVEQQQAFDAAKAKAKAKAEAAQQGGGEASGAAAEGTAAAKPGLLPGEDEAAAQCRRRAQMQLARLPPTPRFAALLRVDLALRRWRLAELRRARSSAAAAPAAGPSSPSPARLLAESLASFHASLGHLDSSFSDARPYLEALARAGWAARAGDAGAAAAAAEACAWLQSELERRARQEQDGGGGSGSAPFALDPLRCRVCALQMLGHLEWWSAPQVSGSGGAAAGRNWRLALLARLHARIALPAAARLALDPRERGPADELPAMVADEMLRPLLLSGQQQQQAGGGGSGPSPLLLLLKAALHLEAACRARPHVAQTRVALCALHGLLGCPARALEHFGALDAKHVQMDTLASHLALPLQLLLPAGGGGGGGGNSSSSSSRAPAPLLFPSALRGVVELCDSHARDAGDSMMTALKRGTHTKVAEFASFRERLASSQACLAARAEGAMLLLRQAAGAGAGAGARPGASSAGKGPAAQPFPALSRARRALLDVQAGKVFPTDGADGGIAGEDDGEARSAAPMAPRALRAPAPGDALAAWSVRARFNADLSVRPAWLPPEGGPLPLAVMRWWERAGGADEAAADDSGCSRAPWWWLRPGAAEAGPAAMVPEAAALRASLRASTEQRALLQHLIIAALGPERHAAVAAAGASSSKQGKRAVLAGAAAGAAAGAMATPAAAACSPSTTPSSTQSLSDLLPLMCSVVARSVAAPACPALRRAAGGGGGVVDMAVAAVAADADDKAAGTPASALLQAADLVLFAAVDALQSLAASEGDDETAEGLAQLAEARVQALGKVAAALGGTAAAAHPLPLLSSSGAALALGSLLAWDFGTRATLCMEACAEAVLAAGGKQGVDVAAAAVAAASASLAACLRAVGGGGGDEDAADLAVEDEADVDAVMAEIAQDPDAEDLFGWAAAGGQEEEEEGKEASAARRRVREVVCAVAEGQRAARAWARARARELVGRLEAVRGVMEARG
jgi:hypothetical protein